MSADRVDISYFVNALVLSLTGLSLIDADFKKEVIGNINVGQEEIVIQKSLSVVVFKILVDYFERNKIRGVTISCRQGDRTKRILNGVDFNTLCADLSNTLWKNSLSFYVFHGIDQVGQCVPPDAKYICNVYIGYDDKVSVPTPLPFVRLERYDDMPQTLDLGDEFRFDEDASLNIPEIKIETNELNSIVSMSSQKKMVEVKKEETGSEKCTKSKGGKSDDSEKEKQKAKKRKHVSTEKKEKERKRVKESKGEEISGRLKELVEKNRAQRKEVNEYGFFIEGETDKFKKHMEERVSTSDVENAQEKVKSLMEETKKMTGIMTSMLEKCNSMLQDVIDFYDEESKQFAGECRGCVLHECNSILKLKGARGRPNKSKK